MSIPVSVVHAESALSLSETLTLAIAKDGIFERLLRMKILTRSKIRLLARLE